MGPQSVGRREGGTVRVPAVRREGSTEAGRGALTLAPGRSLVIVLPTSRTAASAAPPLRQAVVQQVDFHPLHLLGSPIKDSWAERFVRSIARRFFAARWT